MTIIDACVSGFLRCNFNSNKNIFKAKIEICPRDVRTNYPQKIITDPTRIPPQKIQNTESSSSPEVTALLSKADKFIQEKKLKKGLELLHQAARINPKDPEILVRIGTVKVDQNEPAEADRYLSKALQQDPGHDLALIMREKTKELALRVDQAKLKTIDSSKEVLFEKFSECHENYDLTKTLNDDYYQFVYHTIAIEGNTLTFQQVRDVLITGKAPLGADVTELSEVIGMEAAIRYVNRTVEFPITEDHILNMHRRVMSGDPDNGGEYRNHQVFVGGFTPPPPEAVPRMMEEFTKFMQSDSFKKLHPIRQSALAHHTLTFIHPFVDGNGRTARLLMNQILLKAEFPYINIKVNDRLEYYRVLDEASKGDILEFERFLMQRVDGTLSRYIKSMKKNPSEILPEESKLHTDPSYRDVIEL